MKRTTKIEVGMYEGKAGFTLYLDTGEREHYLFSPDIAESLAKGLLKTVEEIRYLHRVLRVPGDSISVSDSAQVRITTPKEESDGEQDGPAISVSG